jgi:hypothetical protein
MTAGRWSTIAIYTLHKTNKSNNGRIFREHAHLGANERCHHSRWWGWSIAGKRKIELVKFKALDQLAASLWFKTAQIIRNEFSIHLPITRTDGGKQPAGQIDQLLFGG